MSYVLFNRNFPPQDRPVGGLNEQKLKYAHETEHISTLAEVVKNVKPTAIIGKILQLFFACGASNASLLAPVPHFSSACLASTFPWSLSAKMVRYWLIWGFTWNLPRPQTSLSRKFALKGRREGENGPRLSFFSLPWSLALSHQSLAFSAHCCRLKRLKRRQAWNCVAIELALPGSRSVQTIEKSGRGSENLQEETRGEPVRIFLNTPVGSLPSLLPEKPFFVSKCQNGCGTGEFHTLALFVWLLSRTLVIELSVDVHVSKLSKLTNSRVYLELVDRNEILKTMLTGSTSLSLPSPPWCSLNFFRSAFPGIGYFWVELHYSTVWGAIVRLLVIAN